MTDLRMMESIIHAALQPFTRFDVPSEYRLVNSVGNACYTKFDYDHVTVQYEPSRGGRLTIDIKYEPDYEDLT